MIIAIIPITKISSLTPERVKRKLGSRNAPKKTIADKERELLEQELEIAEGKGDLAEITVYKNVLFLACETLEVVDNPADYFDNKTEADIYLYNWGKLKNTDLPKCFKVDNQFLTSTIKAAIKVLRRGL